jgi:histidinol dehydrogenase
MELINVIDGAEFGAYQKSLQAKAPEGADEAAVDAVVNEIIEAVMAEGDAAVRRYASRFEKEVPLAFEIPIEKAKEAWENLKAGDKELAGALTLAADHLRRFAELQKEQFKDFEAEIAPGLFAGQKVIPVDRAAIYVPAGRFPLISSSLMGLIPAAAAGVREKILVSPPGPGGVPDSRILAAAFLAGADRVFSIGGAQAIAALAFGTKTIPRADLIAGPGNKYVAAAKRLLFGKVGIDFVAGPTDVLIITDTAGKAANSNTDAVGKTEEAANLIAKAADLIAADMLAQAEHDPDAKARALAPDREMAEQIVHALTKQLALLPTADTARASLKVGGLIIVYKSKDEAIGIANEIAPEHLELHVSQPDEWIGGLKNYGSLFIRSYAAEALGDYSAGINHTLPTSGSARFTGGLSVRNFLKTVTSLRCTQAYSSGTSGYAEALAAAQIIARAEGLAGHAESAALRQTGR